VDPISLIVLALAAGAAAGLKPVAAEAVRDSYAAIKQLISRKYGRVDLAPLEEKPSSEAKRASLTEDLQEAGAGSDAELLARARELVALVEQHDAAAAEAIGVDLGKVKAEFLRVGDVVATAGTGFRVAEGEFTGGVEFGNVRVGPGGADTANPPRQ
jgi:hypothetical protein